VHRCPFGFCQISFFISCTAMIVLSFNTVSLLISSMS
jgi:hypothetical protein